ncbi:hypothetical protein E4T38_09789 [Aureobasidium subglaciale]|nr:hypothetical protein E4T38_09789 [Aureobasidium subglaciale]KAI5213420.1 hypothetical protein E4T40_09761 [Aureobasidium subglaciale]KAI5214912.1 hypothetical protein E4T41_09790 [Aureobasidium subglaciale]KAI5252984.1 hypothetical protein E4T46_09766 [Aureobasidium subglaciale]
MFKSILFVAATAIAPVLVRADFCKGQNDVFFFAWTVNLSGIEGGCDAIVNGNNFQAVLQGEGGCFAVTAFSCQDPEGGGTTFTFNQSDFCDGGSVADAVSQVFNVDAFSCSGQGPA